MPDKHYLYASDAVTDNDVTKKARINYDRIIREEEKTTDVAQTRMFAGPSDIAGARGTVGGYATHETPEAMPQTQRSASCLCTQLGETEFSAGLIPAAVSESSWNTKSPRKEQCYQKTFVPFLCLPRHGNDVKADQLDKDLMEYAMKLVRPVSLCTDKTSYRFGLLMVELKGKGGGRLKH